MLNSKNKSMKKPCNRCDFIRISSYPKGMFAKFFMIMKLSTFLIFLTFLQASAKGYSQMISLSVRDVPIEQVFRAIEKQSSYVFFFDYEELSKASKVSVNIKNGTLKETLDKCLQGQPLNYSIVGQTIVIKPKVEKLNEKL